MAYAISDVAGFCLYYIGFLLVNLINIVIKFIQVPEIRNLVGECGSDASLIGSCSPISAFGWSWILSMWAIPMLSLVSGMISTHHVSCILDRAKRLNPDHSHIGFVDKVLTAHFVVVIVFIASDLIRWMMWEWWTLFEVSIQLGLLGMECMTYTFSIIILRSIIPKKPTIETIETI